LLVAGDPPAGVVVDGAPGTASPRKIMTKNKKALLEDGYVN